MIEILVHVWILLVLLLLAFFSGYWIGKNETLPVKPSFVPTTQNKLFNLKIRLGDTRFKTSKRRKNSFHRH